MIYYMDLYKEFLYHLNWLLTFKLFFILKNSFFFFNNNKTFKDVKNTIQFSQYTEISFDGYYPIF
jgi:hypothetical protein